jgi:nitric oxide reductase NorQ protein
MQKYTEFLYNAIYQPGTFDKYLVNKHESILIENSSIDEGKWVEAYRKRKFILERRYPTKSTFYVMPTSIQSEDRYIEVYNKCFVNDTDYIKEPTTNNQNQSFEMVETKINPETLSSEDKIKHYIHVESLSLKPENLIITDLKWKYLVRSAVRGKNIMMTGDAGSGKTLAAKTLVKALKRPDFYFNLGSTQDARATLIGNTQFSKENGTFFAESAFVKAIKTPDAVILLDEISRAHPDAWNILMTVLDQGQRYLRLDEAEGSPTVEVAEGVTFIATANIGTEYTSTRVMDRAIVDRFTIIEMDLLDASQEYALLKLLYPEADQVDLKSIAEISHHTREVKRGDTGKLSNSVSTRASVEMAGLINDGFELAEAAEISIFPFFSQDGGLDSERTYVKQLVQKYIKPKTKKNLYNSDPNSSTTSNSDDSTFDIQF